MDSSRTDPTPAKSPGEDANTLPKGEDSSVPADDLEQSWMDPNRWPADADELQEWLGARSMAWLALLRQLGLEAFTVWEFAHLASEAESTMKDIESGLASMYSPSCKAAEEKFASAELSTLYQEADRMIDELTTALRSVLYARARDHAEWPMEDWEREDLQAWIESGPAPSPEPAPRKPQRFNLSLLQPGALALQFKITEEPAEGAPDLSDPEPGVVYQVQRRVGEQGDFEHLTTTEHLGFRDNAIPVGTQRIVYRVTPVRGQRLGPPAHVRVDVFPNGASMQEEP